MLRFGGFIVITLLLSGCQVRSLHCTEGSDCESGEVCWRYTCVQATDVPPDGGPRVDLSVDLAADLSSVVDADLSDLWPPDLVSAPDLPPNGALCAGDSPCASGQCVDGRCCDAPCAGLCQACNLASKEGVCSSIASGADPDGECLGQPPCGADVCDGKGACTAPATMATVCKSACKGSPNVQVEEWRCDGKGACSATAIPRSCSPYQCDGKTNTCATSCWLSKGCAAASACDRSAAHVKGRGLCVPTAKVKMVSTVLGLQTELSAIIAGTSARTHVRLAQGTYLAELNLKGPLTVTLVGDDGAKIKPPKTPSDPVLTVQSGVNLVLQMVDLKGSSSHGLYCQASASSRSSITLLDGVVEANGLEGVYGSYCDFVFRRVAINTNKGGGVKVNPGNTTLINSVVRGNGSTSSAFGGLSLAPGTGNSVVMVNNTVIYNTAAKMVNSAVLCSGVSGALPNNLLLHKTAGTTQALATGCAFVYSRVPGTGGGVGNITSPPLLDVNYKPQVSPSKSPCIDAGQPTTQTVIDKAGKPRPASTGGKVDIGAYEVM